MECKSRSELQNAVKMILSNGGEGVILQKRKSIYESGRSTSLLKIKVSFIITIIISY